MVHDCKVLRIFISGDPSPPARQLQSLLALKLDAHYPVLYMTVYHRSQYNTDWRATGTEAPQTQAVFQGLLYSCAYLSTAHLLGKARYQSIN